MIPLLLRGVTLFEHQVVVVGQFLAWLDRANRVDEYATVFLVGFTIRSTRMIDPACRATAFGGVYDTLSFAANNMVCDEPSCSSP